MQYKANHFSDAVEKLKNLGISYERAARMTLEKRRNLYGCGADRAVDDTHIYFMAGNTDVAYFTLCTQSLIVHDVPRVWGNSFLECLTTY